MDCTPRLLVPHKTLFLSLLRLLVGLGRQQQHHSLGRCGQSHNKSIMVKWPARKWRGKRVRSLEWVSKRTTKTCTDRASVDKVREKVSKEVMRVKIFSHSVHTPSSCRHRVCCLYLHALERPNPPVHRSSLFTVTYETSLSPSSSLCWENFLFLTH